MKWTMPLKSTWLYTDEIVEGFVISACVTRAQVGWIMTDLCISASFPGWLKVAKKLDGKGPMTSKWIPKPEGTEPEYEGITSRALTGIKLEALRREIAAGLIEDEPNEDERDPHAQNLLSALGSGKRVKTRDDLYYAQIADAYLYATMTTPDRNVYEHMAKELNRAPSTLKDAVKEARRRGLLTPPLKQGAPGGTLTRRAQRLLYPDRPGS